MSPGLSFGELGINSNGLGLCYCRLAIDTDDPNRGCNRPLAKPRREDSITEETFARDHGQILSATRSLALRALGFRLTSASEGTTGFLVNSFNSFFCPHWHCGIPGRQIQS